MIFRYFFKRDYDTKLLICGIALLFCFGLLSAVTRHYFDDELLSFRLLREGSLGYVQTIQRLNSFDHHPPLPRLQMLLAYDLFGDFRYASIMNILFLVAACAFLFRYSVPYISTRLGKFLWMILLFLNPAVMLWGTAITWYPHILALFIVGLTLAVFSVPRKWTPYALSLCCALMIYVNYVAFVMIPMLLLMWWVKHRWLYFKHVLIAGFCFLLLTGYQLYIFRTVHMHHGLGEYQSYVVSILGWGYTSFIGNSVFPLSIPVVLMGVVYFGSAVFLIRHFKQLPLASRSIFWSLVSGLVLASLMLIGFKISARFRNSMFLIIPIYYLLVMAVTVSRAYWRYFVTGIVIIFTIFSISNVLRQVNTAKNTVNMPIWPLKNLVRHQLHVPKSSYFYVQDPVIAYYLRSWGYSHVYSYWTPVNFQNFSSQHAQKGDRVIMINTYRGDIPQARYDYIRGTLARLLSEHAETETHYELGYDRYSYWKSKLREGFLDHLMEIQVVTLDEPIKLPTYAEIESTFPGKSALNEPNK